LKIDLQANSNLSAQRRDHLVADFDQLNNNDDKNEQRERSDFT